MLFLRKMSAKFFLASRVGGAAVFLHLSVWPPSLFDVRVIVTVYSVEDADGIHFITMELVEGRTLAAMLPRNGFRLSELLGIAIPLADAVSSAHRMGITHRDLKPDNIMVDNEGRLRVLDFGLAKLHDPA